MRRSGVAEVLYKLKCGDAERFRQVQECFRELTGKELELRVRHLPAHEDGRMMIASWVAAASPA